MSGFSLKVVLRSGRGLFLALLMSAVTTLPASANGWEHWGIPLKVLLDTLDGDDPGYRLRAARSLGFRRELSALPRLLQMLRDSDERPRVRSEVAQALARIGDQRAVPGLINVLRTDPREELRGIAATSLGHLALESAVKPLITALETEQNLLVQIDIVSALGAFSHPMAVAALSEILESETNTSLHRRAIIALGRSSAPEATTPLLEALRVARNDSERATIVTALGRIANTKARRDLENLFDATKTPMLKVQVAAALGAIRDGSVVPKLIEMLDDDLAAVRFFAVDALAAAKDTSAAVPLRLLYRRATAASASLVEPLSRQSIATFLAEQSLRVAVIRALTALEPKKSVGEFLDAAAPHEKPRTSALGLRLNEGFFELRRAALVGLGYSRTKAATNFLTNSGVLSDRDFRLRATALRALGVLRDPSSASAVVALLDDGIAEVRWVAAKVLGRLGNVAMAQEIHQHLDDPHPEVRRQAALSLGYLKYRASCPNLVKLSKRDETKVVREAASMTLAHLCTND